MRDAGSTSTDMRVVRTRADVVYGGARLEKFYFARSILDSQAVGYIFKKVARLIFKARLSFIRNPSNSLIKSSSKSYR